MADIFLSDVHLRLDRPERGQRLAKLVDRLDPTDRLIIVGDLCDFWFASRQRRADPARCPGLRSIRTFRERGGTVLLLVGNHDLWLGPYFRDRLGVTVLDEPQVLESFGRRVHLAHGHRSKTRPSRWKTAMESHAFLRAFGALPWPVARGLEVMLDRVNERRMAESNRRMVASFREQADALAGSADLVVFGHAHVVHDDPDSVPRLVVLGDWTRGGRSYLRIDDEGVRQVIESGGVSA